MTYREMRNTVTALTPDLMTGKVVLVVGGTQGLGSHIARRAAESGAEAVVVSDLWSRGLRGERCSDNEPRKPR
jgi:NAD(P)-dependent dehydrogenase (short-subunit alcohol dehydrogenase family)